MSNNHGRKRIGQQGYDDYADETGAPTGAWSSRGKVCGVSPSASAPSAEPTNAARCSAGHASQRDAGDGEVRRACRNIRGGWTDGWSVTASVDKRLESEEAEARVFPVVDDVAGIAVEGAREHEVAPLHLRVGIWEICIGKVEG